MVLITDSQLEGLQINEVDAKVHVKYEGLPAAKDQHVISISTQ